MTGTKADTGLLLDDRRVLVAIDGVASAYEAASIVKKAGAIVIGPHTSMDDLLDTVISRRDIEFAIVCVDLEGETTFVAIDRMLDKNTRVMLVTSHNSTTLPERFTHLPIWQEPVTPGAFHLLATDC